MLYYVLLCYHAILLYIMLHYYSNTYTVLHCTMPLHCYYKTVVVTMLLIGDDRTRAQDEQNVS